MESFIKSLKYVPKLWAALGYLIILIVSLVLFFGRNIQEIRIKLLLDMFPKFYAHVSNFSLTLIIFITIGYIGLMMGLRLKQITIIGILFGILNLIFEFFITLLNTPDKTDAAYGISGVIFGLIFLFIMKKSGFKKNEL